MVQSLTEDAPDLLAEVDQAGEGVPGPRRHGEPGQGRGDPRQRRAGVGRVRDGAGRLLLISKSVASATGQISVFTDKLDPIAAAVEKALGEARDDDGGDDRRLQHRGHHAAHRRRRDQERRLRRRRRGPGDPHRRRRRRWPSSRRRSPSCAGSSTASAARRRPCLRPTGTRRTTATARLSRARGDGRQPRQGDRRGDHRARLGRLRRRRASTRWSMATARRWSRRRAPRSPRCRPRRRRSRRRRPRTCRRSSPTCGRRSVTVNTTVGQVSADLTDLHRRPRAGHRQGGDHARRGDDDLPRRERRHRPAGAGDRLGGADARRRRGRLHRGGAGHQRGRGSGDRGPARLGRADERGGRGGRGRPAGGDGRAQGDARRRRPPPCRRIDGVVQANAGPLGQFTAQGLPQFVRFTQEARGAGQPARPDRGAARARPGALHPQFSRPGFQEVGHAPPLRLPAAAPSRRARARGGRLQHRLVAQQRGAQPRRLRAHPAAAAGRGAERSSRILFVAEPTVPGAIGSDRIVMKPSPIQVTLLGDGRWVEPAPAHIRNLLARSLANTGPVRLRELGDTVGPLPDFTLMTDVERFEAELAARGRRSRPGRRVDDADRGARRRRPSRRQPPLQPHRRRRRTPTRWRSSPPSRRRRARSCGRRCPGRAR